MKLLPGFRAFDDVFDDMFTTPFFKENLAMKTDIHQINGNYVLNMEVPGFNKEDIHIDLSNGYLNVEAVKNSNTEEKDKKGNIIRQERYSGSCSRSFYVGNQVREEDIQASYTNGELKITFPDKEIKAVEEKKYINID